jgi:hypothetical protein
MDGSTRPMHLQDLCMQLANLDRAGKLTRVAREINNDTELGHRGRSSSHRGPRQAASAMADE